MGIPFLFCIFISFSSSSACSPLASFAAVGRRVLQLSSGMFEARNIVEHNEVGKTIKLRHRYRYSYIGSVAVIHNDA